VISLAPGGHLRPGYVRLVSSTVGMLANLFEILGKPLTLVRVIEGVLG
jgi:hypothetical protein